jgi:hypothetical protein
MRDVRTRAMVCTIVAALWFSFVPAMNAAGNGTQGQIWLDCDPGEQAHGGGWQAGGVVCLGGDYDPNALLTFDLIVENRDNVDQTNLKVALAIHSESPPTTGDDLVSVALTAPDGTVATIMLADFGTSEFNPFDEAYGGRHHVYVGTDAIWALYDYPDVLAEDETVRIAVAVQLGPDPSDLFEIHFDAFDVDTGAKSPNGHDVTLTSGGGGGGGQDQFPTACISGGDAITVFESDLVVFDGTCSSDPDGVIVSWEWDFDLAMDSDGDGDPANDVDATGPIVSFTWYDDYESEVLLTVTDDDALTDSAVQVVTVLNVAPRGTFGGAFVEFNLTLRVAGEKYHNINVDVFENYDRATGDSDGLVGSLEVERWPGSPDKNPTAGDPSLPLRGDVTGTDTLTAVVTYDPYADAGDLIRGDQPINGQLWGDNPIWLVLTFPDGDQCRIFHNFNVRQSLDRNRDLPEHFAEPWIVDLVAGACVGIPITFVASGVEVGTDDVTFTWDFGDGTIASTTYLYDAMRGPDPAFPPGSPYEPYMGGVLPPLNLADTAYHTYTTAGTYTVTLTVSDDDGGAAVITFEVIVTSANPCK